MAGIIEPKVNVISYGPTCTLEGGQILTPDEFVWGAAAVTYKDMGALQELFELKRQDKEISENVIKSLIKSAGAGHASMATTPGLWAILEGNCSKLVDAMFTGARFSSSLMPSGRRVPIALEQIVTPKGVAAHGSKAQEIYQRISEANINGYLKLQEMGVPKEEAAKIVQYGHRGGGLIFLPLETIIHFAQEAETDPLSVPLEGKEILHQLEEFIHSNGMWVVYEARKAAPRAGCPNPNIFHNRRNLATESAEDNSDSPRILREMHIPSEERDRRINEYLKRRNDAFSSSESTLKNWRGLLRELEGIVGDYNNTLNISTFAKTPLRVWGEVKRHRTLPQTVESIYHAIERAQQLIAEGGDFSNVVSLPSAVTNKPEALRLWLNLFTDSINAYTNLINMGVERSDAVALVPRGLKIGVVKSFDLYNLTTGYTSLRLCSTAEKEMRETTERERALFLESPNISPEVKSLIAPKCAYVGQCCDKKYCGNILKSVPEYNSEFHVTMQGALAKSIREKLS